MQRRSILLIARPLAPQGGSHATRINGLVEALLNQGHDVTVLTTTVHKGMPGLDWNLLDQIKGAKVLRAFCGPFHFASYLRNSTRARKQHAKPRKRSWKSLVVPDTYIEWVPFAIGLITLVWLRRQIKPNLIISSATPYSCHLIGLWAKRLFGVPWVADFGDPWVIEDSVVRGFLRHAFEQKLEGEIIRRADAITWTTRSTCDVYSELYPEKAHAMHVLYMGFRIRDFVGHKCRDTPVSTALTLTYAGRINVEHRDGSKLVQLLARTRPFTPFRLCLAGTGHESLTGTLLEAGLQEFELLGLLNHADFVDLLMRSDVLVLLGNSSPLQVPGKLFQYLGTGRPILYVKNMRAYERDEVQELISMSNVPHLTIEMSAPIDGKAVGQFLMSAREHGSSCTPSSTHSWDQRAKQLMQIVTSLATSAPPISGRHQ